MIATSVEQSKKLLELGLDTKTADMYYHVFSTEVPICEPFDGQDLEIPCWSLSALLDLMPVYITTDNLHLRLRIDKGEGDFSIWYDDFGDGCVYKDADSTCNNPIDAAVGMIEWLITNKYLKV